MRSYHDLTPEEQDIIWRFDIRDDIPMKYLTERHNKEDIDALLEGGWLESTPGTRGLVINITPEGGDKMWEGI